MGTVAMQGQKQQWTTRDIGDQSAKVIVITGANSGIGFATAQALGAAGATIVMACRNPAKAQAAKAQLEATAPAGRFEFLRLDLADQGQIAEAGEQVLERFGHIDVLVNNAGVLGLPYSRTVDGHEMTFGTNHLGPFAFTGHLLPRLLATPNARIVTVSSLSYAAGKIRFGNLDLSKGFSRARAYSQSKLANLLFSLELDERLRAAGVSTSSIAVHPGFAATEIVDVFFAKTPRLKERVLAQGTKVIPPETAAGPSLRASTASDVDGGQFYGPGRLFGITGAPIRITPYRRAIDADVQRRLWEESESLTGMSYRFDQRAGELCEEPAR